MDIQQFLDLMKKGFQLDKVENNQNKFFESFFYFKRNIKEFITEFNCCSDKEKENINSFLLSLYPLSDYFLSETLKARKFDLSNEITLDTINYINNSFIEEFKDLNISFDDQIKKNIDTMSSVQSIIDINQIKFNKLVNTKKDLLVIKEKDEKLSKDIKELENANLSELREELNNKQKRYDELKQEKNEMNSHLEKVKKDINELAKYSDLRDRLSKCRDIIQDLNLPRDYTDKQLQE